MKLFLSLSIIFLFATHLSVGQTLKEKVKSKREAKQKEFEADRKDRLGELKSFKVLDKKGRLKTLEYYTKGGRKTEFQSEVITLYSMPWFMEDGYNAPSRYAGEQYFVKRPNEKYARYIGRYNYGMKQRGSTKFRKIAEPYFSDYPELRKKIKSNQKGYRPFNIPAIVKEYSEWKSIQ